MKKFYFIVLVCLMVANVAMAQRPTEVIETNGKFGKETKPGMVTKIVFADAKSVEKEFISYLKGYSPETITSKKGVIFADNVKIPAISDNAIDVYATVSQDKGSTDVELVVSFDFGGLYITSTTAPEQYQTASNMVKVFASDLSKKNHDAVTKEAGKELAKAEKKLESLEKNDKKMNKDITSYQKKMDKLNNDIEQNKKEIMKCRDNVRELKAAYNKLQK